MYFYKYPFCKEAADRLVKFNVKAFKIGSGECNNYPLVNYISKFKKPIILSTGMNSVNSVKKAVRIIEKHRVPMLFYNVQIYILHPHILSD